MIMPTQGFSDLIFENSKMLRFQSVNSISTSKLTFGFVWNQVGIFDLGGHNLSTFQNKNIFVSVGIRCHPILLSTLSPDINLPFGNFDNVFGLSYFFLESAQAILFGSIIFDIGFCSGCIFLP